MEAKAAERHLDVTPIQDAAARFIANMETVIVGKRETIELVFVALLCEGHILIEDVPGVGKTLLAKAFARSLNCSFRRIQCTPDLLPSDVTGIHYYNQKTGGFELRPGPVFANIVLVDEVNRATPRTQSCLLECMQEQQVTVDLETIPLPRPFLLIATQNPIELQGTFPLPEAQLDRFLFKVNLGYPTEEEEGAILVRYQHANPLTTLAHVIDDVEIFELQSLARQVYIDDSVRRYMVALVRATRTHEAIKLGASPRAALSLELASQALAAVRGREYVIPDDVKGCVTPLLIHRLIMKADARLRGHSAREVIEEIVFTVAVPTEDT